MPRDPSRQESLGELVSHLVDNAKDYVRAEVALVRQTAMTKIDAARPALAMIVAAILIVQAALTVMVASLGMTLAIWIGPAGGLALGAVVGLGLAGLLAWLAIGRFKSIG